MSQLQTYLNWLEARGQKFPVALQSIVAPDIQWQTEPLIASCSAQVDLRTSNLKRLVVFCNDLLTEADHDFLKKMHLAVSDNCGPLETIDRSNPQAFELLRESRMRGDQIILMLRDSCEDDFCSSESPASPESLTLTTAKIDVIKGNINEKRRFWHQLQRFLKIKPSGIQS
jgi:hypothetical protein